MPAKRPLVLSYACGRCTAASEAPEGSALALLQLCAGCQEKRFKAGKEAQRKAGVTGG